MVTDDHEKEKTLKYIILKSILKKPKKTSEQAKTEKGQLYIEEN